MRKVNNPFRFRRSVLLLAASIIVSLLILAAASVWSVGPLRAGPDEKINADLAANFDDADVKRSLRRLAEKALDLKASRADDARGSASRKRRGARIKPFVIASAVGDGKLAYARTSRTLYESEIALDDFIGLPTEVIVRDLATGAESTVFKSRSALVGSLLTRGGTVAFGVTRLSEGRRGIDFDTSVLHVSPGASAARVVRTDTLSIKARGLTYCGEMGIPSAIDEVGNLLVVGFQARCERSNDLLSSQHVIGPDGNERSSSAHGLLGVSLDSTVNFSNGRVFAENDFANAIGLRDLANGAFTELISGEISSSALAADGTAAAVLAQSDYDWPPPKLRLNSFLVFPEGDPDRVVVASRMAGKIRALEFCGDNLFAVKQITNLKRDPDDFEIDGAFDFAPLAKSSAKYRVLLYDKNGVFVRALGDTPGMALAAAGCDGTAINLLSARGKSVTLLRYAP